MADRNRERARQITWLCIGLGVPILALMLTVVDGERIAFRFLPDRVFPHSCISRSLFGIDCPGCGLTRSIVFLAQGQLEASLAMHRLGWLAFLLIVSQVPIRLWQLRGGRVRIPWSRRTDCVFWLTLTTLLLLNLMWGLIAAK